MFHSKRRFFLNALFLKVQIFFFNIDIPFLKFRN